MKQVVVLGTVEHRELLAASSAVQVLSDASELLRSEGANVAWKLDEMFVEEGTDLISRARVAILVKLPDKVFVQEVEEKEGLEKKEVAEDGKA